MRDYWLRRIERLDPAVDFREIYGITSNHEFPWDMNQSLSLALFRTFAVPSIGNLLYRTGEFTERTQKRYDDTAIILDAVVTDGFEGDSGRAAIRRMNQMHRDYGIGNDDLRYVLCTFVVCPLRWLDEFGWRPMSETEKAASANYYRELGRHMGIKGIPSTWQEFCDHLDDYEAEHFAFDEGARQVADATLRLMATFPLFRLLPEQAVVRSSYSLMDEPLLDAFHYPHPRRAERALVVAGVKARARAERLLPPRMQPLYARDMPTVRGYPNGFDLEKLGTFGPQCPVPHDAAAAG